MSANRGTRRHEDRRREAIVFLVRREPQHVLLFHRCAELGGFWHGISGEIEADESPEQAAIREVLEETGLDVAGTIAGGVRTDYSYARGLAADGRNSNVVVHCFVVTVPNTFVPELNWEHDEARWCGPAEACSLVHWDSVRTALHTVLGLAA